MVIGAAAHLAAYYRPARGCGGDWWAAETLPGNRLLVAVGDVTGHETSAAILTGIARAICDAAVAQAPDLTCADLLQQMNRAFYGAVRGQMTMSCIVSIIDPARGEMTTANAGHTMPYLLRSEGERGHLSQVIARGSLLGAAPDSAFEITTRRLEPGDLLLWYTDGITECTNKTGQAFGEKRLRVIARRGTGSNAARLRDLLIDQITRHTAGAMLDDDMTMVVGTALPMDRREP